MAAVAEHPLDEAPGVVASPDRVNAWMEVAKAGDVFVYATRLCLPAGSAGARRMRDLAAQGLVHLTQKRSPTNPALFCYRAERSGTPYPLAKEVRETLRAPVGAVDDAVRLKLLPLLERAAQFARPCPTDKDLARRAKMTPRMVELGIEALRKARLISVQPAPAPTLRRIIILATGQQTGLAA